MKKKYTLLLAGILMGKAYAQNTFSEINEETAHFLNRLETISGSFSDELFLTQQPLSGKDIVSFLEEKEKINLNLGLSNTDNILARNLLSKNGEWALPDGNGAINSSTPVLGTFYKKQDDFLYHNSRDFFLSFNPVLGFQGIYENTDTNNFKYNYTIGAALRMKYKHAVSAALNIKYISERPVSYIDDMFEKRNTVAGVENFSKPKSGTYNYWLPTGYISANLLNNYINITAGYDYQKIGDGYRTFFLSDFSSPVFFGKIVTKIWKLQYENLYMKLSADHHIPGNEFTNYSGGYKYATAHHLSANITPWLNMGLFEMVVFNRENHFEVGYMNPIIFYRAIERSQGSPDKVAIGLNAKAIALKHLNIYGQFLLNEFTAKQFFGNKGYMHNKWAAQLGIKYFDAFGLSNLDIQGEMNLIRPYTFQHSERGNDYIVSNFTNNNLSLSHPLGAGFREFLVTVNYRPISKLNVKGSMMFYQQGIDTGTSNLGNDISKPYNKDVPSRYGVRMINGPEASCLSLQLNASYEIKPNLYFDLGGVYRKYEVEQNLHPSQNTTYFYSGIRLNLNRKDYNYL